MCYEPDQQQCADFCSLPSWPASSALFDETECFLLGEKSQVQGNPCITFGTGTAVKDELWLIPCRSLARYICRAVENKVKTKI